MALGTVVVALGAIAVLGTLTLIGARGDISQLARQEQEQAAVASHTAATEAYRAAGSWSRARLRAATVLAASSSAKLIVLDARGDTVATPPIPGVRPPKRLDGPVMTDPVIVDGRQVGTTIVEFYRPNLGTPESQLRSALVRTVAAGAGLGAVIALVVAVVLSRRISRPIIALITAVRAMGRGDRSVRVVGPAGFGEIAELSTAFETMAATVVREEDRRRAVMADVAHELRTPLAILQVGSESLIDGTVEASPENLASFHEEVVKLGRMVEDLDALASAETSGLRVDLDVIDLDKVVGQSVDSLRQGFSTAGVHLVARLRPVTAEADPVRVEQVARNLLGNALKFSDQGGQVTVEVSEEGGCAVLRVSDTGRGIPQDELSHVFERFWRGREAGRVAGSGIGLAVVKALVDAQGGTVEVASAPAEGTMFVVRLPTPYRSEPREPAGVDWDNQRLQP